ncbi:MAG TPA: hypothetical protein VGD48_27290 [Kutzneria sp.]|jgi:hypothetical protein
MKKGIASALAVSGLVAIAVLGGAATASATKWQEAIHVSGANSHRVVTADGVDPNFP